MRKVKIVEEYITNNAGRKLACPVVSDSSNEALCNITCAWFRIEEGFQDCLPICFCGDNKIGELMPK